MNYLLFISSVRYGSMAIAKEPYRELDTTPITIGLSGSDEKSKQ